MAKNSDDAKRKHVKNNEGHAVALVLREKWLQLSPRNTKANWNIAALKDMKKKYAVKWKERKPENTITRFVKPKTERIAMKPFNGDTTVHEERLCKVDQRNIFKHLPTINISIRCYRTERLAWLCSSPN